jgi:hypothetical protein
MERLTQTQNPLRKTLEDAGFDPDVIRDYLEERIELDRAFDAVASSTMTKIELVKRETRYTQLERYILNLK